MNTLLIIPIKEYDEPTGEAIRSRYKQDWLKSTLDNTYILSNGYTIGLVELRMKRLTKKENAKTVRWSVFIDKIEIDSGVYAREVIFRLFALLLQKRVTPNGVNIVETIHGEYCGYQNDFWAVGAVDELGSYIIERGMLKCGTNLCN